MQSVSTATGPPASRAGAYNAGMNPAANLVLVGPMGAGKTTLGRALAARLGLRLQDVDSAVEQPADPFLAKTKRSTLIRLRMHACMDDADGYFASWDQAQEPILSAAWIEFQRGATTGVVSNRKPWIENDPRAAKIGAKYRQLPESYQPALHRWAAGE